MVNQEVVIWVGITTPDAAKFLRSYIPNMPEKIFYDLPDEAEIDGIKFCEFYGEDGLVHGIGVKVFSFLADGSDIRELTENIFKKAAQLLPKITEVFQKWGAETPVKIFIG